MFVKRSKNGRRLRFCTHVFNFELWEKPSWNCECIECQRNEYIVGSVKFYFSLIFPGLPCVKLITAFIKLRFSIFLSHVTKYSIFRWLAKRMSLNFLVLSDGNPLTTTKTQLCNKTITVKKTCKWSWTFTTLFLTSRTALKSYPRISLSVCLFSLQKLCYNMQTGLTQSTINYCRKNV